MITSKRMGVVDANAHYLGVEPSKLMENAGAGLADVVEDIVGESSTSILVVAGRGNNGGDALVAARFLEDYDTEVLLLGRAANIRTEETRDNWEALVNSKTDVTEIKDSSQLYGYFEDTDVIIDGMLGTGVSGGLREPVATAVSLANESDATVVSVDVPSGIDPDTADGSGVEADRVVTFHDYKPAHEEIDAEVELVDIGIPDAAENFVGGGDLILVDRDVESHKGDNGDILVVGGGPYTGAPALSATAALRSGCDLVTVATPEPVAETVQSYSPNLIVRGFEGSKLTPNNTERVVDLASEKDLVVIGPGLGSHEDTLEAAHEILEQVDKAVVDADAISAVGDLDTSGKEVLITPHAGELAKLGIDVPSDWRERRAVIEDAAQDIDATVLLKGSYDVVSDGETTRVSRTGNPGMTVGGTGDVLAGVCGFLLSQLEPVDAAGVGAFVNGWAGDLACEEVGSCLTATDVIERLPEAFDH